MHPTIHIHIMQTHTHTYGGVMVLWFGRVTRDQRVVGSNLTHAWHFCPSARQFIHIAALDPGVVNGYRQEFIP